MGNVVRLDEFNIFDQCERHENVTVEILTNSETGQTSIGWYPISWHNAERELPDVYGEYLVAYRSKGRPELPLLYDILEYEPITGMWTDSFYSEGNGGAIVKFWMALPERPGE